MSFLTVVDTKTVRLRDHGGGFDPNGNNSCLDQMLEQIQDNQYTVISEYVALQALANYRNKLIFQFDLGSKEKILGKLYQYDQHPTKNISNFLCSFNGTPHVGRKLLVSAIKKFGWFDPAFCSKNFAYDSLTIDGHIADYENNSIYNKFFINSEEFNQAIYTFGHNRFDHAKNIYNLENQLSNSFLHLVSETMATSYYPFVTEKFLYSIVTRGLFLAYAQPGWHDHVTYYYGFRKYDRIFDYRFDSIQNPVERLIELMSMIAKFSVLNADDWQDLYEMEIDTIEYNYDHYFSGRYLDCLRLVDL